MSYHRDKGSEAAINTDDVGYRTAVARKRDKKQFDALRKEVTMLRKEVDELKKYIINNR